MSIEETAEAKTDAVYALEQFTIFITVARKCKMDPLGQRRRYDLYASKVEFFVNSHAVRRYRFYDEKGEVFEEFDDNIVCGLVRSRNLINLRKDIEVE